MIIKTKGYVFRTLKYGDHQVITDIFTESNGLLTFIVPGARKGGVHSKGIFLQPLSSLDLIIEVQDGKNLQKIKEIKFDRLFTSIQSDWYKCDSMNKKFSWNFSFAFICLKINNNCVCFAHCIFILTQV